jgi:antitoxin (DNA-binding transcriptional repressor) of toxin-antitoxin stability system
MKAITTHYAKTHLSRLLRDVQNGETVVILHGKHPVGRLVPVEDGPKPARPKVGTRTSAAVTYADDAFAPLNEEEMCTWGL